MAIISLLARLAAVAEVGPAFSSFFVLIFALVAVLSECGPANKTASPRGGDYTNAGARPLAERRVFRACESGRRR